MVAYFPGITAAGALAPGLSAATVRNTLGLGTADSPTFAGGTLSGKLRSNVGVVTSTGSANASGPSLELLFAGYGLGVNNNGEIVSLLNNQAKARIGYGATVASGDSFGFSSGTNVGMNNAVDTLSCRDGAGIWSHRNGLNAQRLRVAKTWTSATSFEQFEIDTTQSGFHDLVALRGSAGGGLNGIRIGSKQDGSAFVPWLNIASNGFITTSGSFQSGANISALGTLTCGQSASIGGNLTASGTGTFAGVSVSTNSSAAGILSGIGWDVSSHLALVHNQTIRMVVLSTGATIGSSMAYGWGSASVPSNSQRDLTVYRGGPNIWEQRNGLNAQRLRVAKTWTSSTSFEQFEIDATQSGFLDLVALRGSAGGGQNGIRIGGKQDGGIFVPWLSLATNGVVTVNANDLSVPSGSIACSGTIQLGGVGVLYHLSRVRWGASGVGEAYIRNANDNAYANLTIKNLVCSDLTIVPSASRTLDTNGQFTFERVSDTEINLVYRGDDGTTRRLVLPGFA